MFILLFILLGVGLLYAGAELLVVGACRLAEYLRIPLFVMGLSFIALATSTPEGLVSVLAQMKESRGSISLGTIIGSNIANIGLILGIGLILRPCHVQPMLKRRDMPVMTLVSVLVILIMPSLLISRWQAVILLIGLVGYIILCLYQGRDHSSEKKKQGSLSLSITLIFVGGGLLFLGAKSFLEGGLSLAQYFDVSYRFVGITLMAVGTSLPELATIIVAALRKREEIILGNIVGSNIYNPLLIVSIASLVRPIAFSRQMFTIDAPVMIGFTLLLFLMMNFSKKLGRMHGVILILCYISFLLAHMFSAQT